MDDAIWHKYGCAVLQTIHTSCCIREFSRQTIDANGKETYLISRILGDTLSLENESAKHPIVILVCPLSLRGMRMGEMHFQLAIFQQRKFRKFRAIASDNCLEYFVLLAFEVFKNLFQKVEWL